MNTVSKMLKKPLSREQAVILTVAVVAAAVILALVTGDAEAGSHCRNGGAWWDWTCR